MEVRGRLRSPTPDLDEKRWVERSYRTCTQQIEIPFPSLKSFLLANIRMVYSSCREETGADG